MDRLPDRNSNRPRAGDRPYPGLGPAIWIAILLACWAVIAEWRMLPELVSAAMAALP
jgi:hypothetical protein